MRRQTADDIADLEALDARVAAIEAALTEGLVMQDGAASASSSFSTVETVKITANLTIPASWSSGWRVTAAFTGLAQFTGTATTITHRLELAGAFEIQQGPQSATALANVGHRQGITVTGAQTFRWFALGNGTGGLADLNMVAWAQKG